MEVERSDRSARILIVDDERLNRELLEAMLGADGFVLETSVDGEDALGAIARHPPDLILLDLVMPGMDGYQVVAALKADPGTRHIPIIIVTGLDESAPRLRGLSAGAEDFLTKPIDRAELRVRVRNLLRLKAHADYQHRFRQLLETEVGSRTAELVESERLYRSTFDAAPVGIVHVGLDGRWLRINQRMCDLLGYPREELETLEVQTTVEAQDAEVVVADLSALSAGTLERQVIDEKRYRRRDGSELWGRVNVSVHRDAAGHAVHFILVVEDITERRTLEAQLRQANRVDAIGQLAAGVAHDFNNLLSVVVSYSEMLAEDLAPGDPMREDLEEIRTAGWRAVELTRQLLAFSRQQVLQPIIVDLSTIVGGMEKMLSRVLGEDVILTTSCPTSLASALLDPGQIEQVLMNLVVNARDAMPLGGALSIEAAEVELDAAFTSDHPEMRPGPHVMLSVADTGSGMDEATQARMFEPFFTTKEVGRGTGLGLATVIGIIRQSGGAIVVTSELGKGTRFKMYFPVVAGTAVPEIPLLRPHRRTFGGHETILLVEDEAAVRTLARTILRRYGYQVLEAQSGGDALLLCEQHPSPIHLLLTDVVMPRMSGRQLAERLLQVRPDMKVLYMSGHMDDAVVRHGVLDSTISFVHKPITPEALIRKVRRTLV
ncbi:MAG: response regulator [Kofleriaceae bacterium]